jgi:dCMP deaminase
MKVYGITGLSGSGKDEATRIFEKRGYQHISLSAGLREEAKNRGVDINVRADLQDLGNKLREEHGAFLADLASKKVNSNQVVFSSIRNIAEVDFLKLKFTGFKMIKIESPEADRFEREKKRNREGAPKTIEEFRKVHEKDLTTGVGEVVASTQMVITNNGTLEKLGKLVTNFLDSDNRPSWDEYFLKIAETVGLRADCCRGRLGTILVRNKQILSAGYNGAPSGLPECSKVGCLLRELRDYEGNKTEHCLRTAHSDLNAIIQAALHGVTTKGATLYGYYKPCFHCAKAAVQAGIVRVVVRKNYHDVLTDELFKGAGITMEILEPHEEGNA